MEQQGERRSSTGSVLSVPALVDNVVSESNELPVALALSRSHLHLLLRKYAVKYTSTGSTSLVQLVFELLLDCKM